MSLRKVKRELRFLILDLGKRLDTAIDQRQTTSNSESKAAYRRYGIALEDCIARLLIEYERLD